MSRTPFPVEAAAKVLRERLTLRQEALLVLGSGLSGIAEAVASPVEVPFGDLPGFPPPGVVGHAGRYVAGTLEGRAVLVQAGRFHLYEGHPADVVCGPVRVAHALGVRTVLLTNAAGGVNRFLEPGSLMLVEDHLNMMGRDFQSESAASGRRGAAPGAPFEPYDVRLKALAEASAAELGIALARGVYAAVPGPSFETPAEIRALALWGADAVGMSTVPEATVASGLGMACLAISLITNPAAGLGTEPLSHEEVLAAGRSAGRSLERLLRRIVRDLPA